MRGAWWPCVLAAAALGAPAPAGAQEGTADGGRRTAQGAAESPAGPGAGGTAAAGTDAERAAAMAEARELFERGTRLMQNENWEMARVELERSYERYPTRATLFNLAMCCKALHRYREALARFDEWQERFGRAASEEERAAVAAAQEELREYVGFLALESDPPGAAVVVDGEQVGTTPLARPLVLDIGRHQVDVLLAGYVTSSRDVTIVPLETVELAVDLVREPPEGGPQTAEAGAEDRAAGLDAAWFWTAAATAAAAGIGGAVAGGMALSQESELEDLRDRCAAGDGAACDDGLAALDDYDAARLAANVLFGAAGAFAATALVLAFFTDFGFGGDEVPPVELTAGPAGTDASGSPTGFAVGVGVRF